MSHLWPACGLVEGFRCSVAVLSTNCAYLGNLKFDSFDSVVVSAALSRLHCVVGDFHVSSDTLVQKQSLLLQSGFEPFQHSSLN